MTKIIYLITGFLAGCLLTLIICDMRQPQTIIYETNYPIFGKRVLVVIKGETVEFDVTEYMRPIAVFPH